MRTSGRGGTMVSESKTAMLTVYESKWLLIGAESITEEDDDPS